MAEMLKYLVHWQPLLSVHCGQGSAKRYLQGLQMSPSFHPSFIYSPINSLCFLGAYVLMETARYRHWKAKKQVQIYLVHTVYGRFLTYLEEKSIE